MAESGKTRVIPWTFTARMAVLGQIIMSPTVIGKYYRMGDESHRDIIFTHTLLEVSQFDTL